MIWNVYIIRFPNRKKYVGVTRHPVSIRVSQHVRAAMNGGDLTLHAAIRKYDGGSLRWGCVARCRSETEAKALEVEYIRELDTLRPSGYNSTLGGNGVIDPSGISESKRISRMKKTMSTISYRLHQKIIQGRVWDKERRLARSEQIKRLWQNPEYQDRQHHSHYQPEAKSHHKVLLSHEEKSRISKAVWSRPGHRERQTRSHQETQRRPEHRRRASEQMKRFMADPEHRRVHAERMRQVMNRPEVRRKCSLAHRKEAAA